MVRTGWILLLALSAAAATATANETSTLKITTIQDVCTRCPERISRLFKQLDLNRPGLADVAKTVKQQDFPAACHALLEYYRNTKRARQAPVVKPTDRKVPAAEAILRDEITCYTITAKVPRRPDGGWQWAYNGPQNDREWGWGLNRHYHLSKLLSAYLKTGNEAYAKRIDRQLCDWILANPYPAKKSRTPQWRGLEVHSRIVKWTDVFYTLQTCPHVTPATRILMLTSIPEHAHYLRHHHAGKGNWVAMEMYALATIGVSWPEFDKADAWITYAVDCITPRVSGQVYPDGVQKELTSHYHSVALGSFERLAAVLREGGRPVPDQFGATLESMWNYLAWGMRPDGYGPLNNDSNRDNNRGRVLAAAKRYKRPDWTYIATNGKRGTKPEGLPSRVFPWAGQLIMRSGWDADAHWAFFDVGPLGIGHLHYDKLHLSIHAYGRDLLVDAGRYTYVGGTWRRYFVGSPSHNVILVDGNGHAAKNREAKQPIAADSHAVTPAFDIARGTFDEGYVRILKRARHSRAVVYRRGQWWVVVDRVWTDSPRTIQPLWHVHPACTVRLEAGQTVTTDEGKGNLRIVPAGRIDWDVKLVQGQTEPHIQGWYSPEYNIKQPSPTVVYSAESEGSTTFAWLLLPARGKVPTAELRLVGDDAKTTTVEGRIGSGQPWRLVVPWAGNQLGFDS